jgi:hypothetical protein
MWINQRPSSCNGRQFIECVQTSSTRKPKAGFIWSAAIAACLLLSMASTGQADVWKSEGNWIISGSPRLGGCSMATRYPSGAFLSITAVELNGGQRVWEMLISESSWNKIQSEEMYAVNVHFLGAGQPQRQLSMTGFKANGTNSIVTNALVFEFLGTSDFMAFVSEGLETGHNIAFVLDGQQLASFGLEHANTAYHEMKECLDSRASNYEA